jgi:hypothetical protein
MDEAGANTVSEGPNGELGYECEDCELAFKTPQGLAGHKRLTHSASTSRELDERKRALAEQTRALTSKERAAQQREADAARLAEAARRKEAEVAARERTVRQSEETPVPERLRRVVSEEIEGLPEVSTGTILRCDGWDYRFEEGKLVHVYFPEGEKTEFEDGEPFQFGGRAYCIRNRALERVHAATLLARVLARGD